MKAARFYNKGDIRIEDIPEPTVAPGTVGINVAWCGICGTDLHEFMEGPIFIPPCGHPHPISGESAPVTMGHEFSGVVYAVGEGVDDIKVGQHVVVEPYIIRDDVPTGEGSNYHLSKDMNFIGLGGGGGGLSEKIAVKRRWVHPISDKIPLDQAALIEPLSVGPPRLCTQRRESRRCRIGRRRRPDRFAVGRRVESQRHQSHHYRVE